MAEPAPAALLSQRLKNRAHEMGFELAGVCSAGEPVTWPFYADWVAQGRHAGMDYLVRSLELRKSLDSILPGTKSVLAVGLNYNHHLEHKEGQPKIARYAQGRDYHPLFRKTLSRLAKELSLDHPDGEFRAVADSAPLLEREWAQRAGLGWPGKNTCLIHSQKGSWFLLGFLLTTLEAKPDEPAKGGCGTCRLCVEACPTGAIIFDQDRWQVDSNQCISYWTIENKGPIPSHIAENLSGWTFGCDICQEVCPFNQPRDSQPQRAQQATHPDLKSRQWPNLQQLAQISYEDWDAMTQGSPVRRRGWQGIRWNAQACLGLAQEPGVGGRGEPTDDL